MTKQQDAERKSALAYLRKVLRPGTTVYTILRHVSSQGTTRAISVATIVRRKRDSNVLTEVATLDWHVAQALGLRESKYGGLVISGSGMDMGFDLVYRVASALYPKGFTCCGARKCRSNDHSNGDRDYTPHQHRSGGYAFRHEWL